MITRVLKTAFLFATYSTLGASGDYLATLVAGHPDPGPRVMVRVDPRWVPSDDEAHLSHSGACAYQAERRGSVPADASETLRLKAGAGQLQVVGKEGLTEVKVVALACASDRDALEQLQVSAVRRGDRVVLQTHYPDFRGLHFGGDHVARLDLTVEIPMGMAADIEDSSGSMDVSGTGSLSIRDGSGSMSVHGIHGPVTIADGSGGIDVADVDGALDIQDGSGGIAIRDVTGSVRMDDGSGGIEVSGAGSDVVVEHDGSGSIDVRDVHGDFAVLHDGSGSVRYARVDGKVSVPRHGHSRN